ISSSAVIDVLLPTTLAVTVGDQFAVARDVPMLAMPPPLPRDVLVASPSATALMSADPPRSIVPLADAVTFGAALAVAVGVRTSMAPPVVARVNAVALLLPTAVISRSSPAPVVVIEPPSTRARV